MERGEASNSCKSAGGPSQANDPFTANPQGRPTRRQHTIPSGDQMPPPEDFLRLLQQVQDVRQKSQHETLSVARDQALHQSRFNELNQRIASAGEHLGNTQTRADPKQLARAERLKQVEAEQGAQNRLFRRQFTPKFHNPVEAYRNHLRLPGWKPPAGCYGMGMKSPTEVHEDYSLFYVISLYYSILDIDSVHDKITHPDSYARFMPGGDWRRNLDDIEAMCHVIVAQIASMHIFGITNIVNKRLPGRVPPPDDPNHNLTFGQRMFLLFFLVKHEKHHADELVRLHQVEEYAIWAWKKLFQSSFVKVFQSNPDSQPSWHQRFEALGMPSIQPPSSGPAGEGPQRTAVGTNPAAATSSQSRTDPSQPSGHMSRNAPAVGSGFDNIPIPSSSLVTVQGWQAPAAGNPTQRFGSAQPTNFPAPAPGLYPGNVTQTFRKSPTPGPAHGMHSLQSSRPMPSPNNAAQSARTPTPFPGQGFGEGIKNMRGIAPDRPFGIIGSLDFDPPPRPFRHPSGMFGVTATQSPLPDFSTGLTSGLHGATPTQPFGSAAQASMAPPPLPNLTAGNAPAMYGTAASMQPFGGNLEALPDLPGDFNQIFRNNFEGLPNFPADLNQPFGTAPMPSFTDDDNAILNALPPFPDITGIENPFALNMEQIADERGRNVSNSLHLPEAARSAFQPTSASLPDATMNAPQPWNTMFGPQTIYTGMNYGGDMNQNFASPSQAQQSFPGPNQAQQSLGGPSRASPSFAGPSQTPRGTTPSAPGEPSSSQTRGEGNPSKRARR